MSTTYKRIRVEKVVVNPLTQEKKWTWYVLSSNGKVQAESPITFDKRWKAFRSAKDLVEAFDGPLRIEMMRDEEVEEKFERTATGEWVQA